jgi:rhodanese-related sulfurtransferase
MKKWIILLLAVLLTACGQNKENDREAVYMNITAEEAKQIMDTQEDYIILDVRTRKEYDQGHIPGAIVISHDEIGEKAEKVLTDKNQLILVYCRSGRRSKIAAELLVELGYTNILEFGGINDWPYKVE